MGLTYVYHTDIFSVYSCIPVLEELIMRLSDAEWKIADCLWDKGSMTITELTRELGAITGWSKNTVITLLKRMIEKGAVTFVQEERAKRFYPAINRTEAELEETESFLDKVYKGNVGLMISNLIGSEKLTNEQIEELRRIIREG